jgi:hypothetical protein
VADDLPSTAALATSGPYGFCWLSPKSVAELLSRAWQLAAKWRPRTPPSKETAPPIYRNVVLGLDEDIPPEQQVRTHIMFPLGNLAELLSTMIDREKRESAEAGWRIPRNATLLED